MSRSVHLSIGWEGHGVRGGGGGGGGFFKIQAWMKETLINFYTFSYREATVAKFIHANT